MGAAAKLRTIGPRRRTFGTIQRFRALGPSPDARLWRPSLDFLLSRYAHWTLLRHRNQDAASKAWCFGYRHRHAQLASPFALGVMHSTLQRWSPSIRTVPVRIFRPICTLLSNHSDSNPKADFLGRCYLYQSIRYTQEKRTNSTHLSHIYVVGVSWLRLVNATSKQHER